ncbi:BCL2/adenovirus E1B 19 kDa protein-interacting protein 2-like isoform X2 [Gambusia affinis]|uniref:BCL2/adenovirus E1B 19 kDa protein-interacting protein 2-like isoform X2 n=1 Tax=Gambusia affinis TaxID=33528 RepID=UPI001CDBC407|nr:BCL2/adenovirus E1B 19 kDa protein-interacting protein 2-like isoform X2 [Gambusia affinis]
MESTGEEHKEETSRIILGDENSETSHQDAADENISTTTTTTTADEETGGRGRGVMATPDGDSAGEEEGRVETPAVDEEGGIQQTSESQSAEQSEESEQKPLTPSRARPAPPSSLSLTGDRQMKKKVLAAPTLSLSLGGSGSITSDDLQSTFLSPSPDDAEDTALDFDLDALETPSDSESLHFPLNDLDLEDDMRRLGVASHRLKASGSRPRSSSGAGSLPGPDQCGLGALEREDVVDSKGTRWRCFTTGDPPQESRVNMSVLEPYLRVLSHGGYYGDGEDDIIVFSSCYLPENSLENYQYVMDNLFRFVIGTLELMVAENYVIVYLCAGGQKEKLPGIGWLKECYTTIDRRLRKNLKGFYVVHPTWYIKIIATIIRPFISSKFSRKLQFVETLQELSLFIPTEHVQIPDCVRQYDQNQSR